MAVAVQAQRGHRAGGLHHALGHLHGFVKSAAPARSHVQRQVVAGQQQVAAGVAEALDVQRRPLCKRYCRAHGVDARQKAANPFKHRQLIELGPAPAAARRHAEGKTGEVVQRLALQAQRANHRNLSAHQLSGKSVLFQNLRIAPAAGPVKLGDHGVADALGLAARWCRAFQRNLVNAVFVAGERRQPAVSPQAHTGERVQHHVGREQFVGMRSRVCLARAPVGVVYIGLAVIFIVGRVVESFIHAPIVALQPNPGVRLSNACPNPSSSNPRRRPR